MVGKDAELPAEQLNGTTINYEVTGAGEPLVLVHGAWSELHSWGFVAPALAESFRVIAFDLRGHGLSTLDPPDAGTVHDDVADLAALISHLGLGPVHLAGNSSGACIVLRFATEHPELVRSVSAHEPPVGSSPDKEPALQAVYELLQAGEHETAARRFINEVALGPGAWEALPPPLQAGMLMHAAAFLGQLNDPDALELDLEALGRLETRVLLSGGTQSPPQFAPILDRIAAHAPRFERFTFPEAGHVPHVSHPVEYVAMAKDFLRA